MERTRTVNASQPRRAWVKADVSSACMARKGARMAVTYAVRCDWVVNQLDKWANDPQESSATARSCLKDLDEKGVSA